MTVRSAGPDRTAKTIDGIHAFRTHRAGLAEVGRELGGPGIANINEKAAEVLKRFRGRKRTRATEIRQPRPYPPTRERRRRMLLPRA